MTCTGITDQRIAQLLWAMRAPDIPSGSAGLWEVTRDLSGNTALMRHTESTMHNGGECVMVDHAAELQTHLDFLVRAKGRVLVSGLGLGCVVRGLLHKPEVTHIDVVEISEDVLRLVQPHMPKDSRLHIHHDNALTFHKPVEWSHAWHDLWTDTDAGEPHLHTVHANCIVRFADQTKWQGAWAMHRTLKRAVRRLNLSRGNK